MMYQADEKRYETMQYNRCGKSGLLLPKVSLGLWHNFGSNGDYDNMKAMCINVNIKMYIFDHLRMYIFAILPLDRYIFLSDKIFL